jgi:hypothetical protein
LPILSSLISKGLSVPHICENRYICKISIHTLIKQRRGFFVELAGSYLRSAFELFLFSELGFQLGGSFLLLF